MESRGDRRKGVSVSVNSPTWPQNLSKAPAGSKALTAAFRICGWPGTSPAKIGVSAGLHANPQHGHIGHAGASTACEIVSGLESSKWQMMMAARLLECTASAAKADSLCRSLCSLGKQLLALSLRMSVTSQCSGSSFLFRS